MKNCFCLLTVVPPTLSHPPQNVTTYTNLLTFFQCGISNETFPPANVEWFKGSDVLNIDGDNLFVSPNTNTLIIHSSTSADEGEYHCQALNDVGSVTSDDVTLTVIDQPPGGMNICVTTYGVHKLFTYICF